MNKEQALAKYKDVEAELKKLKSIIEAPEDLFSKIKNYDDVCVELKEDRESCPYKKIKQIEKLFNQGWIPNWSNQSEYKYYPYFSLSSGEDLVFDGSGYHVSFFFGGCAYYKNEKTSIFVGKTFTKEYNELKNNY